MTMRCPRCGHENLGGNAFCNNCGLPLAAPAGQGPVLQPPGGSPAAEGDLAAQVRALRERLDYFNARLVSVERSVGIIPASAAVPRGPGVAPLQPLPASAEAPTGAAPPPLPGLAQEAPPPSAPGLTWQQLMGRWEQILGGNWLAIVGGLAVVVGVGFFLKLAFDNNWIGERGRVMLGVLAGLAFLAAGERYARRYGVWAQAVTATGIAILYLATFAALVLYDLIHPYAAFAFLALVTTVAGVAALRYEAPALAALSIVGGMVPPLILVGRLPEPRLLAVYVGLLDLGVVGLATFRNWRPLTLLGFLGSLFWFVRMAFEVKPLPGEALLTVHFLLFVGATTLFHLLQRNQPGALDFSLMTLNAGAYFLFSVVRLGIEGPYEDWLGLFAVGLAAFYALLASRALALSRGNAYLTLFLGGIAAVLLTVAVPLQFQGPWVPIAWAAEGVVLVALGVWLGSFPLRVSSLLVLGAALGWLLVVESQVDYFTFRPLLNGRFAAFSVGVVALYLSAYLLWRGRDRLRFEEERVWVLPGLLVTANLLTLWTLSFELVDWVNSEPRLRFPEQVKGFGLSFLWGAYSVGAVVLGLVRRARLVRLGGLTLFWVTVLKVFLVDTFELALGFRVASFLILGALLLATAFLYQRYRRGIREFLLE